MGLKKNLLIVDKNDVNRKILREMLYNTYNILEADNSGDAINMLDNETEKIACIILDLVTPEENDFNFLETVSESKRFSNIPVLVATLDNESEKIVQDSLEKLAKGRTVFTIAHRLTTIRNANMILVLTENGIEEQGTHQELIDKKGLYYNLYSMYTSL